MIEKRKNPRIQTNDISVIFKQQAGLGDGIVQNISIDGALLRTGLKINIAAIEVLIKMPPLKFFYATGEVVWQDEQEYFFEEHSFGIKFHSPNKKFEDVIKFSEYMQHPKWKRFIKLKLTDKKSWWRKKLCSLFHC